MMDIHETTKEGAITGDNDIATDQAVNHEPKMASLTSSPSISVPSTKNLSKNKRSRVTQQDLESTENPGTFDHGEGNSKRQKLSCEHWYVWNMVYLVRLFVPYYNVVFSLNFLASFSQPQGQYVSAAG